MRRRPLLDGDASGLDVLAPRSTPNQPATPSGAAPCRGGVGVGVGSVHERASGVSAPAGTDSDRFFPRLDCEAACD